MTPSPRQRMTHSLGIILGGAACVWDDLEAVGRLCDVSSAVLLAVNDAGYAYPGRVDHWCSLHPANFERWEAMRAESGYEGGYVRWARTKPHLVDRICPTLGKGTSAMLAVSVANRVGCERVVLCGCPLDRRPHFHGERRGKRWGGAKVHQPAWVQQKEAGNLDHVRSMSGWSRRLLGAPEASWLA